MAQPATTAKIEELRFRVKTDPKSRLFYPLAEELRKIGQHADAEQVLRAGLTNHASYLSGWVSLGRVLRDQQKNTEAVEALKKALQVDPGNVVAARLLADTYLSLGEKIEAIKKYKLVYAQVPGDQDLEAIIYRLEQELNPEPPPEIPAPKARQASPAAISPTSDIEADSAEPGLGATFSRLSQGVHLDEPAPFEDAFRSMEEQQREQAATGDAEPMSAAHSESPFEDRGIDAGYGADAFAVEHPPGVHITPVPPGADAAAPAVDSRPGEAFDETDPFGPSGIAPGFVTDPFAVDLPPPPPDADDFARTITMADLYANQGLIDEARDIYEDVLMRDPSNASVRAKLKALSPALPPAKPAPKDDPARTDEYEPFTVPADYQAPPPEPPVQRAATRSPKVEKLENWLSRVTRKEDRGV